MCILNFRLTTKVFKRSMIDTLREEIKWNYLKVENKEEHLIVQKRLEK